jgi:hypothetical protein
MEMSVKNTKIILKVIGIAILGTVLVGLLVFAWFKFGVMEPYESFLKREQEIRPLFDALDTEVESQLPPLPSGSKLLNRSWYGLDNSTFYKAHGRWLTLDISTMLTPDAISAYYHSALLEKGWEENQRHQVSGSIFYYRGTSCIELGLSMDSYYIVIWHDFEKQPFSPVLPDQNITMFFEAGRKVAECP